MKVEKYYYILKLYYINYDVLRHATLVCEMVNETLCYLYLLVVKRHSVNEHLKVWM